MDMWEKYYRLKERLKGLESAAVAFSGGTDSALLLRAAAEALGADAAAFTADLSSMPRGELKRAEAFCKKEGVRHIILSLDQLRIEGFAQNPKDRCYICKRAVFGELLKAAEENNFKHLIEGSNADDLWDYRPGLRAIRELNIESPMQAVGLNKEEIRSLSKELGLDTWDKPSMPCLVSRIPYGEKITAAKLEAADKGEGLLRAMGFKEVRVRVMGKTAKIEVSPYEIPRLAEEKNRTRVLTEFEKYGFIYVTMDLKGYRLGSLNEAIINGGSA